MKASKMSSTLPAQDYQVAIGDWLCSTSASYLVRSFLGEGAFGQVVKCTRVTDRKTVAIKIIKNQGIFGLLAREEVAALMKLKSLDPDECNIVRWYQDFTSRGQICLEFEQLDKSLLDLMKERHSEPLLLKEIRPIVQQLATALKHLKAVGIIHTDLKLDNVMLVNHVEEPYRIKVIDFGLAEHVSAASQGSYIQTLPHRSPEIILGLPYNEAVDMWSVGCIAAELYLGSLLYPGMSEYDVMRYIMQTQGQPPQTLLSLGHRTHQFFREDKTSTTSLWKLKSPEQFMAETGIQSKETRREKLSSLYDLLHVQVINPEKSAGEAAEMKDHLMFVDMLCGMLALDPAWRMTPRQVLEHHFITMNHMANMDPLNSHVRSCFQLMEVCQKQSQTSGSGTAVRQTPSRTTCSVQQNLNQPHNISPDPWSGTQTTRPVRSGVKRRVDEEDERMNETSHPSKRRRSGWHRGNGAGLSTFSRSSQDSVSSIQTKRNIRTRKRKAGSDFELDSDCFQRSEDRKRFRISPSSSIRSNSNTSSSRSGSNNSNNSSSSRNSSSNNSNNNSSSHRAHSSLSIETESWVQSGLKRKAEDDEDVLHKTETSDLMSDKKRQRTVVCYEKGEEEERRRKRKRKRRRGRGGDKTI